MIDLHAHYDGPRPKEQNTPLRFDGFIRNTLHIIRARRKKGIDNTLNSYVTKLNHLVTLEKARETGQ